MDSRIINQGLSRKRQESELRIMGDMEREIRNKLAHLEESIRRRKKQMTGHQRSISNPEENTDDAIEMKQKLASQPVKTKSNENIAKKMNKPTEDNKAILRSSMSHDNHRINKQRVAIIPDTRRRPGTPDDFLFESHPQYNHSDSIGDYNEKVPRPQTSNATYSSYIPPADNGYYARPSQVQPSNVMKALSTGVATKKYIHADKENVKTHARVNPSLQGALYAKKKSLNAAVPRDQGRWQRTVESQQTRSSSAFGTYKTNISSGVGNTSLTRQRANPVMTRPQHVEQKQQRIPGHFQKEERYHSVENLLAKRPLAKTNSTILNSNDFQIISLESRTVAQQIKLKQLEKNYYNEDRILSNSEWATFVSKFSATQKEVRSLDYEWQELFNELIHQNSEYNENMNKIRMWVSALKEDSKFLHDIMARNLVTPM